MSLEKDFSDKDILHVKKGNIEYLQFKILNKYQDKIKNGITLRCGGVSSGLYDSLNFRLARKR